MSDKPDETEEGEGINKVTRTMREDDEEPEVEFMGEFVGTEDNTSEASKKAYAEHQRAKKELYGDKAHQFGVGETEDTGTDAA